MMNNYNNNDILKTKIIIRSITIIVHASMSVVNDSTGY